MFKRFSALVLLAAILLAAYDPKPLPLSQGGTSAATAVLARDAIEHASAGTAACASPCTPAAGIKVVSVSGATTIVLPDITTYATLQTLRVLCDSASSCAVTLDPSDSSTCDGGSAGAACSAITVSAHGIVGAAKTGTSTWGSVQPGSPTVNAVKLSIAAGVPYLTAGTRVGNTFTATGAATTATSSGDTNGFAATMAATNLTVNAATAVSGNNDTTAQYWSWQLSTLGVTIPADTRMLRIITSVSSFSEGARTASAVSSVLLGIGTAAQTGVRASGFIRPGSGTAYNHGRTAGSAGVSSFSGTSTVLTFDTAATIGDATSTETLLSRIGTGNNVESGAGLTSAGAISATMPTYLSLYVQVTGATTTTTWTLNDLTGYVVW